MKTKILEYWLDNSTERGYQPAFCQMLLQQGFTVLHSTRHCAIELGKDVIARDSHGNLFAYQLKGNPRSKINLTEFRSIEPQLRELVHLPVKIASVERDEVHRSFLVTNGGIEEETHRAILDGNEANKRDGYPHRKLEVLTRGELLNWACKLDDNLWPDGLIETRQLLEIVSCDGKNLFPIEKFQGLLKTLLRLDEKSEKPKLAEWPRFLASATLLTSVCLTSFSKSQNHYAEITAWSILAVYAIASQERWKLSEKALKAGVGFCEDAIFKALQNLTTEVTERGYKICEWGGNNGHADFAVLGWRCTVLLGLISVYYLSGQMPEDILKAEGFKRFIRYAYKRCTVFGEGAIPFLLHAFWARNRSRTNLKPLIKLMERVMREPLADIYQTPEAVLRSYWDQFLEISAINPEASPLPREQGSFVARLLMLHLVFIGHKETCQNLWQEFSFIQGRAFYPSEKWRFCLYRSQEGDNKSLMPHTPETWSILQIESEQTTENIVPNHLLRRPYLLSLWILICPHRALHEVVNQGLYKTYSNPHSPPTPTPC